MDKLVGYTSQWNIQSTSSAEASLRCKWISEGKVLGLVAPHLVQHLKRYNDVFIVNENGNTMTFAPNLQSQSPAAKSDALQKLNSKLRDQGVLRGWRNEMFPVSTSFSAIPELLIERAACGPYGVKAYGCHINGFVRDPASREITHMWVGKRCATKSMYPGMLDHIVAGGLPHGVGVTANVLKECGEEASIPEEVAATARSVGAVTNNYIDERGNYLRDVSFCFDLELPVDFVPVPQDGEVECFRLLTLREVLNTVLEGGSTGFKPNCNLVIIDFFIRLVRYLCVIVILGGVRLVLSDCRRFVSMFGYLAFHNCDCLCFH